MSTSPPRWSRQPRVAIIGAGFGGIGTAIRLQRAGFDDVAIFERDEGIGGTWWANTYPGVACDAPSHIYSFRFAPNPGWSCRYAPGGEIQQYLEHCVDEAGLRPRIRTGCAVRTATWDDGASRWQIGLEDGTTTTAEVLVAASGALSEPSVPDLPGVDTFRGPAFHTARWRHDVDLTGLRVGVVGTGASAVQVVPAIAEETGHLTVFQRSAPYVLPKRDGTYSPEKQERYRRHPALQRLARRWWVAAFELVHFGFWGAPRLLTLLERQHRDFLAETVPDEGMRAALTPDYRAGCKRPLISSDYYPALVRPDVSLETRGIAGVEPDGVRLDDGTHVPLDVLVFSTGFRTTGFATSVEVRGRDGTELQDAWSGGARAHLGLSVPGFPNLFLVYGPNTNLGAGSIIDMIDAQARHITGAVEELSRSPEPLEVTPEAFGRSSRWLSGRLPKAVWSSGCDAWYLDAGGRDTHNWPGTSLAYQHKTATLHPADYGRPTTHHDDI